MNIINAIKEDVGTVFSIQYEDGYYLSQKVTVRNSSEEGKYLEMEHTKNINWSSQRFLNANFKVIKKPITLEEALKSGKKFRLIKEINFNLKPTDEKLYKIYMDYIYLEYMYIKDLLELARYELPSYKIDEILNNKCWISE